MEVGNDLKKLILDRTRELESSSSIEFVPRLIDRAHKYTAYRLSLAVLLTFLFYLAGDVWLMTYGPLRFAFVGGIFVLFYFVLSFDAVFSIFLNRHYAFDKLEAKAQEIFLTEELFKTQSRSAILVLVSKLEKQVYVFADKGFDTKVSSEFWAEMGSQLAKDFNSDRPLDSFFSCIQELSSKVAQDFPPCSKNPNELPDGL